MLYGNGMKMKATLNSSDILIREPSENEFLELALFSFKNFISETAKSTGENPRNLESKLGGPPVERKPDDLWLIFEYKNQRIGYLWIQINEDEKTAFGWDIYLEPEYRSLGIGHFIMQNCGNKLRALAIDKVKICVYEHNKIAMKLYEKLGFKFSSFNEKGKQFTLEVNLFKNT